MKFRPGDEISTFASVIFNPFLIMTHECNQSSDPAHEAALGGFIVSQQQQYQDHPDKRNNACQNQNGIERVGAGSLTCIGNVSDQLKCDDRPKSGPGSSQPAYRSH